MHKSSQYQEVTIANSEPNYTAEHASAFSKTHVVRLWQNAEIDILEQFNQLLIGAEATQLFEIKLNI